MLIIPTEKRFDWRYAPTVLIALIVINVLVFFFYQSNDDGKMQRAVETYLELELLETEWPFYEEFVAKTPAQSADEDMTFEDAEPEELAAMLLLDNEFYIYLQTRMPERLAPYDVQSWQRNRERAMQPMANLSHVKWALLPKELRPLTLLTHQFLHGDVMHLLGNLFFLAICGFAVEAAIGHWRFLAFYLVGGVVAGLSHAALDFSSTVPLIGASGAISAVMAMYLGVFRLRKIEFLYWIFIFVGYFRAPALLMLPIYIGKEVLDYLSDPDGGVAFIAHAGGFAIGAVLIALSYRFSKQTINHSYVDEQPTAAPLQLALDDIYRSLNQYQFDAALRKTNEAISKLGSEFRLEMLRYQLCLVGPETLQTKAASRVLACDGDSAAMARQQLQILSDHPSAVLAMNERVRLSLISRLCRQHHLASAEQVFNTLQNSVGASKELELMAAKLASAYAANNQIERSKALQSLARQIADSDELAAAEKSGVR